MSIKVEGFAELMRKLQTYGNKTSKAAGRKAIRAGTTILKSAIKSEVPVAEGKLKKATDMKVYAKGGNFGGIVGADVADLKADHEAAGGSKNERPTNIDHLVNYGHVTPDGRFVAPNGYMQRGAAKGMAAAESKVEQVMRDAIDAMDEE